MTGRDSCNGDSGGPLVGRQGSGRSSFMYLYGVVSFGGNSCDGSNPGDNVIKHFFFLSIALQTVWEIARLLLTFSAPANSCPQGILTFNSKLWTFQRIPVANVIKHFKGIIY
jgi:hypothetical protein